MNIKDYIKWLERLPSTTEVTSTILSVDSLPAFIQVTSNFSYWENEMKDLEVEPSPIDDILSGKVEAFEEA